jgi:sulfur carrier protein ThiS
MDDHTSPGSPALVVRELRIIVDVWLYGALACYGTRIKQKSFANLPVQLPEGSTMANLLAHLGMVTEERGITFINGRLSAMPGLQPDLGHILHDGDRIALFDLKSMWPFQYRHGAMLTDEMANAMNAEKDHGLHHTYKKE